MSAAPQEGAESEGPAASPASEEQARSAALRALGQKERSVAEMRALLERTGVAPELGERVIGWLCELGDLDDERFAERFSADKRELRGWGSERIAEALRGRGIANEVAERAAQSDRDQERERAISLLTERGEQLTDERAMGRALGFLARRGYDSETAHDVVRAVARRGLA